MSTTTDLTPERLDELERKYKPNYPAVYIDNKTARSLIAMARAKQAAERERDEWRGKFLETVAEMAVHIDRAHDLEIERDALREAGQALVECILSDDFTEEATPQHDCGYLTDAAGCSFHERFWGAVETLHPTYGLDEEGLDEYEAALAQPTDAGGAE